jgi:hypothetical protein
VLPTGAEDFKYHPLNEKSFDQLSDLQRWAAKKLGWTQQKWDGDDFIPGNLVDDTFYPLNKTEQERLLGFMGHDLTQERRQLATEDDQCLVSANYLATRVLRYTVSTYELHLHYPAASALSLMSAHLPLPVVQVARTCEGVA